MQIRTLPLIAMMVAAVSLFASDKQTPSNSVLSAKSVNVMVRLGANGNNRVKPDAKRAKAQVEDVIRKWGRLEIVDSPNKADLLMIVTESTVPASAVNGETPLGGRYKMNLLSDSLAVYRADGLTRDSKPVWIGSESNEDFGWPAERVARRFRDDWQRALVNAAMQNH